MKKKLNDVQLALVAQEEQLIAPVVKMMSEQSEVMPTKDDDMIRATYIMSQAYVDKIKAYAYWERVQIKDVMQQMCEEFFAGRKIRSIPSNKKSL